MRWLSAALLVALLVPLLAGCDTRDSRIERNLPFFHSLPPEHQALIDRGQLAVGFSSQEVYLAWGKPSHEAVTQGSRGRVTTWIYTWNRAETYYRTLRYFDERSGRWEYIDQPYTVQREVITKEVVLLNDRVDSWTIYDAPVPWNGNDGR
ncbi:MAG: hypothetical protein AB1634_02610 [Thermodesulfobacteriota bacterium]